MITFVAKSSQDSPLLGRPSEHKVELELHSCASSHQVVFPLFMILCLKVARVGEATKKYEEDREDLVEDESKV